MQLVFRLLWGHATAQIQLWGHELDLISKCSTTGQYPNLAGSEMDICSNLIPKDSIVIFFSLRIFEKEGLSSCLGCFLSW